MEIKLTALNISKSLKRLFFHRKFSNSLNFQFLVFEKSSKKKFQMKRSGHNLPKGEANFEFFLIFGN